MKDHWYCVVCEEEKNPHKVKNDETCEDCGYPVKWIEIEKGISSVYKNNLQSRYKEETGKNPIRYIKGYGINASQSYSNWLEKKLYSIIDKVSDGVLDIKVEIDLHNLQPTEEYVKNYIRYKTKCCAKCGGNFTSFSFVKKGEQTDSFTDPKITKKVRNIPTYAFIKDCITVECNDCGYEWIEDILKSEE